MVDLELHQIAAVIAELAPDLRRDLLAAIELHANATEASYGGGACPRQVEIRLQRLDRFGEALAGHSVRV